MARQRARALVSRRGRGGERQSHGKAGAYPYPRFMPVFAFESIARGPGGGCRVPRRRFDDLLSSPGQHLPARAWEASRREERGLAGRSPRPPRVRPVSCVSSGPHQDRDPPGRERCPPQPLRLDCPAMVQVSGAARPGHWATPGHASPPRVWFGEIGPERCAVAAAAACPPRSPSALAAPC